MKGLVKSTLATALALATGQAFALGLGPIQVKSGLNQPLVAEIPVLADTAVEMNELRVDLATAEDFARVGLNRARVGVPIEFSIGTSGKQTVIRLTTKEIVREPFLDFLIQVNWSKGKLLREYTVLLDPPVAPAVVKSVKQPAAAPPPPVTQSRPAPAPAPRPAPPPVVEAPPPSAPPVAKEAAPAEPAPKPAPRATAPSAAAGEYGPVKKGETLSSIAASVDAGDNINQVMLALLKANPKAFYADNVNMLKSGAVLRIPSAEEVAAAGSLRAAASAIRAQNESWREGAKPTQVNQTGGLPPLEAPAPTTKPAPGGKSEHLALVPPKAGSGSESGAERPGAGSGNAKEAAEARAELSRTKETLASKEQEAAELKSRVKQLEDINDKGRHLISLKDSEIADLQNKLKDLQAKANAKPAAPGKPELAPVAKIPDIVPVPPATKTETPAKPTEAPPVVDKLPEPPKPSVPAKTETANAPAPAPSATPAPAPTEPAASAPAASTPAPTTGAVVTPLPDNAPPAATTPPAKPAAPKPAVPAPAPAAPEQPWYTNLFNDNPYALYGVGGVLLLIGLWALSRLFGKKKGAAVRPQFGSGPQVEAVAEASEEQHEQELRDRLAHDPHDIDASMELLRHYYVQGDAQRFESLAESLHEHVHEDSVEWEEVRAMGEGLSPQHHLFAEAGHTHAEPAHEPLHGGFAEPDLTAGTTQRFDFEDLAAHTQAPAPAPVSKEPEVYTPDFDLGHAHEEIPTRVETSRAAPASAPVYETVAAPRPSAQEFSAAEDTIGTRLDLARAYLDMGDPEGARSMLDEVLAEGNAAQKEEAHKLLEELRLSR